MSHHYLDINNVSYTYPDGFNALKEVSFHVTHGESLGLVGANGSGKTTLLHLLIGIMFPQAGSIDIGGVEVNKMNLQSIRREVGFVFQDSDDQLFMPTVGEDIAFGPRNLGVPEPDLENRIAEALHQVGIEHLRRRSSHRLSGGEKRCAAIASVLAMRPEVLLMDEPTSSLDPRARRRIIDLLKKFPHSKLITTHDLESVVEVCDRVLVLDKGRIVADGPTRTVLADFQLMESVGLEVPYILR